MGLTIEADPATAQTDLNAAPADSGRSKRAATGPDPVPLR